MRAILLFLGILFLGYFSSGQRANYWYFGANAGLNFNTSPPTPVSGGQTNIPDNSSSISNLSGNLLFYTNGTTVWNANHVVMPNGSGLISHLTAGQCALIVPIPCNSNKYVIFQNTEFATPGQLHYSVVDMSLNGGLGDVVSTQKNISLGTGWTEKLCAYYNPAGNNYWVLAHKWNSNQFVAFSVSASAIATQSVVTGIGSVHSCGAYSSAHDAMGQLTISPDGTKVLNALTCQDKYELFDFNPATGVLSNLISLPGYGSQAWGTAFSPDSKKIFTNAIFGQSVYQYDITNYSQTAIIASQATVVTVSTGGYNFGYMELGPDNKLYIARPSTNFLSVVNNPNILGSGCNFSLSGQSLGTQASTWGLSRIAYNIPNSSSGLNVTASPSAICVGQTSTLTVWGAASYSWSNIGTGSVITVTPAANTVYTVTGNGGCGGSATLNLVVNPGTVINATASPSIICAGQTSTLTASGATSYTWSNSSTSSVITVTPATSTFYTVIGTGSCSVGATLNIVVNPLPVVSITGPSTLCSGNSVALTATGANSYSWNTSSTASAVVIAPTVTTTYSVTGTSSAGCTNIASHPVSVFLAPLPTIFVSNSETICRGKAVNLSASGASSYSWNTGVTTSTLAVTPSISTTYTVTGSNSTGCYGQATVTVKVVDCTEIAELQENDKDLRVYPSFFKDEVSVELLFSGIFNEPLLVLNSLGEIVWKKKYDFGSSERKVSIDLSFLASGIYYVGFYNSGKPVKIMKL